MLGLGVDIGGTKLSAGLVTPAGAVERRVAMPRSRTTDGLIDQLFELIDKLFGDGVVGIGVGIAGLVSGDRFVWGPNMVGEKLDLAAPVREHFGVPVIVDNDANLAALAEATIGAGRGHRSTLMLTLGTGIGGGFVVDGEVWRGRDFAFEVGHMIIDVGGPRCTCGQSGCWEVFASGRRLDQMARDQVAEHPSGAIARLAAGAEPRGSHVTRAAAAGDGPAIALCEEVGTWLGIGIANLVAILDPEVVVVGGGVSEAGDLLLRPARTSCVAHLEGADLRLPTPILPAAFGEDAGLVGAALAGLDV